ncbi:MAG: glycosyltransferase [Phycisphaeraceae bacterium]
MRYSFVIPAHNEAKLLPGTLRSIHEAARTAGLNYEVIVVDDGSTDETAAVARESGARVVRVEHRQISRTRNSGVWETDGKVLIFIDADTRVTAGVLTAVDKAVTDGAVGGGAWVRFGEAIPFYARIAFPIFTFIYLRLLKLAAGCFLFCTRETFEATGGFDETLFACEEVAFSRAVRRHGRFVIVPEAVLTSARKLHAYSPWYMARMLLRFILLGGMRSMRQRKGLDFWYGSRKPNPGKD